MFKIVPSTLNINIFMLTCHLNSVSHLFLLLFLFIFFFYTFFSSLFIFVSFAFSILSPCFIADSDLHHLKSGRGGGGGGELFMCYMPVRSSSFTVLYVHRNCVAY